MTDERRAFASLSDFRQLVRQLQPPAWEEIPVEERADNLGLVERWYRETATGAIWRLLEPDPPFRGCWEQLREPAGPADRGGAAVERGNGAPPAPTREEETTELQSILVRMIALLQQCGEHRWAHALERLRIAADSTPREAGRQIRSLYGGMGSLGDLVLYRNGVLLREENDAFDSLRRRLHELSWLS
jgi:hypothetical protein